MFSTTLCSCSVLIPGKQSTFITAYFATVLRNNESPNTIHFVNDGFAGIAFLFPFPAISTFAWSSLFLSISSSIFRGSFADPPVAFSPFQRYTYHSSNSLSQPLQPSRTHNYNDTTVHTVHIGFLTSDSCHTQNIRVERCSPIPQQDQDSAPLHRL